MYYENRSTSKTYKFKPPSLRYLLNNHNNRDLIKKIRQFSAHRSLIPYRSYFRANNANPRMQINNIKSKRKRARFQTLNTNSAQLCIGRASDSSDVGFPGPGPGPGLKSR